MVMPRKLRRLCTTCLTLLLTWMLVSLLWSLFGSLPVRSHISVKHRRISHPVHKLLQEGVINRDTQCHGRVTVLNNALVLFRDVTFDASLTHSRAQGGVELQALSGRAQNESAEVVTVERGFLSLLCPQGALRLKADVLQLVSGNMQSWRDAVVALNTTLGEHSGEDTLGNHSYREDDQDIHSNREDKLRNDRMQEKNQDIPNHRGNNVDGVDNFAQQQNPVHYISGLTLFVAREEYANVFWTIIDLYDVYVSMRYLNHTRDSTTVVLFDAHPAGHLDGFWAGAFPHLTRVQALPSPVRFETLSWRYDRIFSPILNPDDPEPFAFHKEFRDFMLTSFGVTTSNPAPLNLTSVGGQQPPTGKAHDGVPSGRDAPPTSTPPPRLRCGSLRVLLIWRHDYIAHARNPSGNVTRKIGNEAELLRHVRATLPAFEVRGALLDKMAARAQLQLLANSDIIVGMHGAALAFSVLLPPGGAVVELYPGYASYVNWHMRRLATGSGHSYRHLVLDSKHDLGDNRTTHVPPDTVVQLIISAARGVCQSRLHPGITSPPPSKTSTLLSRKMIRVKRKVVRSVRKEDAGVEKGSQHGERLLAEKQLAIKQRSMRYRFQRESRTRG